MRKSGVIIFIFLALVVWGCALGVRNEQTEEIRAKVVSLPDNQDVIALSADQIIAVMRRAGFSDEQILDLGTDLRNSLAIAGAAQIEIGDRVEAIFAVRGKNLHVSSYSKGSFIFSAETGEMR